MSKTASLPLVALVCVALYIAYDRSTEAMHTVEYLGQQIRLSKAYDDLDTYKNDPLNIADFETGRVQQLVMTAPVANSFAGRLQVFQATQKVVFPGYGSGSGNGISQNGQELLAIDIEIPRADKNRYLLFRASDGAYRLVDDFVGPTILYPYRIRETDGFFVFESHSKEHFRRKATQ